ncbi:MAG: branched-chain amino acid ABC transporter permease, partial [bacterium]
MDKVKKLILGENKQRNLCIGFVLLAYVIVEIMMRTGSLKHIFINLLVPITSYIIVALALNLVVGVSGELSLGHAGFMSIGAFTGVIVSNVLTSVIPQPVIRLIIAIICGAIVSGIFGFLISIPVLKLQGDYLAIVTLAFGQIIKSVIENTYLEFDGHGFQFSFVTNKTTLVPGGKMLINGPIGANATQRISTFTAGIILLIIVIFIIFNFINSAHGRNVMATRDDRIAT